MNRNLVRSFAAGMVALTLAARYLDHHGGSHAYPVASVAVGVLLLATASGLSIAVLRKSSLSKKVLFFVIAAITAAGLALIVLLKPAI